MPEQLTPRQELAVEQLASDERLTASLTDALATPLLNWAGRRAADLAGRMDLDDEQLAERLRDLRRAIRQVAGQAGPLLEAGQYIAQVEQLIGAGGRARYDMCDVCAMCGVCSAAVIAGTFPGKHDSTGPDPGQHQIDPVREGDDSCRVLRALVSRRRSAAGHAWQVC
jgi:uncharacterized membrane protein YccC